MHRSGCLSDAIEFYTVVGGTSIKQLISGRLCHRHHLGCGDTVAAFAEEASVLHDIHPGIFDHGPNVNIFRVAVLREPLSRIMSSFHYEGYRTGQCDDPSACTRNLSTWIADTQREAKDNFGTRIWHSVSEYYTRIFAGVATATSITEEHYRRAVRRLGSFNAIFLTEHLGDKSATSIARAVFPPKTCIPEISGGSSQLGFSLRRMTRANSNAAKKTALGPSTPSALAREDLSTFSTLRDLNVFDSRLYLFSKRLHLAQALAWERAFESPSCPVSCPSLPRSLPKRLGVRIAPDLDDSSRAPLFGCRKKRGWRSKNSSSMSA